MLVTDWGMETDCKDMQALNTLRPMLFTESGMVTDCKDEQSWFVARIDNQRVAYNTVEKSYRGCFENVKSCRFNVFNFI